MLNDQAMHGDHLPTSMSLLLPGELTYQWLKVELLSRLRRTKIIDPFREIHLGILAITPSI